MCLSKIDMNRFSYEIIAAHKSYCAPNWNWVNGGQDKKRLVLWLVHSGAGQAVMESKTVPIHAGDCFLWRRWEWHDASHDPENPLVVSWIDFECLDRQGRSCRVSENDLPRFYRQIHEIDFLAALMERSIEAFLAGQEEQAIHWLDSSLREIIRLDLPYPRISDESFKRSEIDRISQKIREHPFERFTVDELAEEAGCSVDHFIRQFRVCKGVTPCDFMLRCRVQTAADLLRYTNSSIRDIAEQLGYPDVYAFSKQFRKRIGQPPAAYREEHRG
jgi:AraC family transcriptional regulator of arabinose operon